MGKVGVKVLLTCGQHLTTFLASLTLRVAYCCPLSVLPGELRRFYLHAMIDLNEIKAKPILHVAERLGISLARSGAGVWNMKDPDSTKDVTSLVIFEKTNSWHRFSGKEENGVSGGSVIDLVIFSQGGNVKDAINYLKNL